MANEYIKIVISKRVGYKDPSGNERETDVSLYEQRVSTELVVVEKLVAAINTGLFRPENL